MKSTIFVMLIMMLALTGMAFAETNDTDTNDTETNAIQSQALNVRYEHLQCKVDFTVGQIELLEKYVPKAVSNNLSDSKDTLETDMDSLDEYVDDINKTAFDTYLRDTFRPNFQKVTQELNSIKKDFKTYNVSNETKTKLIEDLKDLREDYAECISDKEFKMGTVMEKHMKNWNKQWGKAIERMKQKDINTTEIEALIAEINAKNEELNALIISRNLTQFTKYMNEFRQEHLRCATRLEAEKLKSYNGKLNSESKKYNFTGRSNDIDTHISYIEKYAQKGGKYQEGEFEHAWQDIRETNKEMKNLSKDILKERARERMNSGSENGNMQQGRGGKK